MQYNEHTPLDFQLHQSDIINIMKEKLVQIGTQPELPSKQDFFWVFELQGCFIPVPESDLALIDYYLSLGLQRVAIVSSEVANCCFAVLPDTVLQQSSLYLTFSDEAPLTKISQREKKRQYNCSDTDFSERVVLACGKLSAALKFLQGGSPRRSWKGYQYSHKNKLRLEVQAGNPNRKVLAQDLDALQLTEERILLSNNYSRKKVRLLQHAWTTLTNLLTVTKNKTEFIQHPKATQLLRKLAIIDDTHDWHSVLEALDSVQVTAAE